MSNSGPSACATVSEVPTRNPIDFICEDTSSDDGDFMHQKRKLAAQSNPMPLKKKKLSLKILVIPRSKAVVQALRVLATSPPIFVHFYFPVCGRSLWFDSRILIAASPYFKDLLQSGFAESDVEKLYKGHRKTGQEIVELDYPDDNDLEEHDYDELLDGGAKDLEAHQIEITQTAYKTYKSLLEYLLTGKITFSNLNSPSSTTSCSTCPKFLYRLAHFLEISQLEEASLSEYKKQLKKEFIFKELLDITSRDFEKIGEITRGKASLWWDEIKESQELKDIIHKLDSGTAESWKGGIIAKLADSLTADAAEVIESIPLPQPTRLGKIFQRESYIDQLLKEYRESQVDKLLSDR